jgi:hypothetical protein
MQLFQRHSGADDNSRERENTEENSERDEWVLVLLFGGLENAG